MQTIIEYIMLFFGSFILVYMLLVIGSYLLMLIYATSRLKKEQELDKTDYEKIHLNALYSKPISVIVPAYNEEVGIVDSVHSLLNLNYPQLEIIIVNDGSKDKTLERAIEAFQMRPIHRIVRQEIPSKDIIQLYQSDIYPHCILVDKENGGKADALNVGINVSSYPYFCSIDGDSILDENSLVRIMKPIMESNGEVIAVGGNVRIANGSHMELGAVKAEKLSSNFIVLMQVIEYLRAFLMGRIAFSRFNLILIISGAFSVFSKKHVVAVGGYAVKTIGEDMELVVKLHRYLKEIDSNERIEFIADPVCYTEAPETLSILRKQRRRWHQGLLESLWSHRGMTLNPKYGGIGLISFPYFWLIECLGPIIELGGYIYVICAFFMGQIYYEIALLLLLLFVIYGSVFSAVAVVFEAWTLERYPRIRDLLRMVILALTEIFWYRPLTLVWRLEGFVHFFLGRKEWGNMERRGISKDVSKEQQL